MKCRLLILLSWLMLGITAQAASFDCRKAQSAVETMVCTDGPLSRLDEELAVVYGEVLAITPDQGLLKKQQREWLESRNRCKEIPCVEDSYRGRLAELNEAIDEANILTGPISYGLAMSKNDKLCKHMDEIINEDVKIRSDFIPENHAVFQAIDWKIITNGKPGIGGKPDFQYQLAKFDIDNDGKNEWVIKFRGGLKGYLSDDLYLFDEDTQLQHPQRDLRNIVAQKKVEITFTGDLYELKELAEKDVLGSWYSIGPMVTLDTFLFDGVFYLSMDGRIPGGRYGEYGPRWLVIARYVKPGEFVDICYFRRNQTK